VKTNAESRLRHAGKWLAAGLLALGVGVLTPGCGPEATSSGAAAPTNNAPPGGSSTEDYNKKMMELQHSGGRPGGGAPSGPIGGAPKK